MKLRPSNSSLEDLPLRPTAQLIIQHLSGGLYENEGRCLMELIRNGLVSAMPNGKWTPGVGRVEVSLEDHSLTEGRALVVFDFGRGFTEENLTRFCWLGRPLEEALRNPRGTHGGASQKGIGRLAAFALNWKVFLEQNTETGFFVLTRTKEAHSVRLIRMIPAEIERRGTIPQEMISSSDERRLGRFSKITGSFSAILIPHPVFGSHDEIRDSIQWLIPRKKDQMFDLRVGGNTLVPPPLETRVHLASSDKRIEVHVSAETEPNRESGIWFTDADTGFRVVQASRLGVVHVPQPFWSNELRGDIFVPNLMSNLDSARGRPTQQYLASAEWRKVKAYLHSARESVEVLVEKNRLFAGSTKVGTSLQNIVDAFARAFGASQIREDEFGAFPGSDVSVLTPQPKVPKVTPPIRPTNTPEDSSGGTTTPHERKVHPKKPKRMAAPVRIGEDDFILVPKLMDPCIFAELLEDSNQILINSRGYEGMPSVAAARDEHILNAILTAAASKQVQSLREIIPLVTKLRLKMR